MADGKTEYIVSTRFEGEGELRRAANEMNRLGDAARRATAQDSAPIQRSSMRWTELASGVALASGAMYGAVAAGRQIYDTLREGAALQTTTDQYERLAASINTTADSLLRDMGKATDGMIDKATLMASASQLMSLGLADNHDQVVRLATVSGKLGWDMQQVILTFANLSTMRLDALGLSVDEVKQKQKELEEQGYSTADAFKEAVIQAGELRTEMLQISDAEKGFKQAEAAVNDYKSALLLSITATLDQAGAFQMLTEAAENMQQQARLNALATQYKEMAGIPWHQNPDFISGLPADAEEDIAKLEVAIEHLTGVQFHNQMVVENATRATGGLTVAQLAMLEAVGLTVPLTQGAADATNNLAGAQGAAASGMSGAVPIIDQITGQIVGYVTAIEAAERAIRPFTRMERTAFDRNYAVTDQIQSYWALSEATALAYRQEANFTQNSHYENEMEKRREATRGYTGALYSMNDAQAEAEAGAARMASTFRAEIVDMNRFMKDGVLDAENYTKALNEGLINAEGKVNVEAMNNALYAQTEAAGASAATLALLGVATGQFTEEQAEAALKAAVLQEQIRGIAEAVTAGDITIGQGLEALSKARENIDAGNIPLTTNAEGAMQDVEGVRTAIEDMVGADWTTVLDLDYTAIDAGVTDAQRRLNSLPTEQTVTLRWEHINGEWLATLAAMGVTSGGR